MLANINHLHDRVNELVVLILFESDLLQKKETKEINARQYAIISQIVTHPGAMSLSELRRAPWYVALYEKRTDKTRQRDLRQLRELGLMKVDGQQRCWPGFVDDAQLAGAAS